MGNEAVYILQVTVGRGTSTILIWPAGLGLTKREFSLGATSISHNIGSFGNAERDLAAKTWCPTLLTT
jgi:hypothetical protein